MIKEEYFDIFPINILKKVNYYHNQLIKTCSEFKHAWEDKNGYFDFEYAWMELIEDKDLQHWLEENINKENKELNAAQRLFSCMVIREEKLAFDFVSIPMIKIIMIDP